MSFSQRLLEAIVTSLPNRHWDNHDHRRFGPRVRTIRSRAVAFVEDALASRHFARFYADDVVKKLKVLAPHWAGIEWLYEHLADADSQSLLVQLMAYRVLGDRKVRLPLSTPDYWRQVEQFEALGDAADSLPTGFMGWSLSRMKLHSMGFPIEFYFVPWGACATFGIRQYECPTAEGCLKALPGEVVMDLGGCWGDTALYFAHSVGEHGRVFTFEFIPSNLAFLRRNLALNPNLSARIEVVENPVWESSGCSLHYSDNGPGSVVRPEPFAGMAGKVETLSVDDLVVGRHLSRVDFIKLDIEGAELAALKGATETLKRDRPKLAIAIYHDLRDFYTIPQWLNALNLGYTFHLKHGTIHAEETILFATAQ